MVSPAAARPAVVVLEGVGKPPAQRMLAQGDDRGTRADTADHPLGKWMLPGAPRAVTTSSTSRDETPSLNAGLHAVTMANQEARGLLPPKCLGDLPMVRRVLGDVDGAGNGRARRTRPRDGKRAWRG